MIGFSLVDCWEDVPSGLERKGVLNAAAGGLLADGGGRPLVGAAVGAACSVAFMFFCVKA